MCGAYGYSVEDAKKVYDRFEVTNTLAAYTPRWNVRIGQMAPVIYMSADGVQIKEMYWSFLPKWAKQKRLKIRTFNARDDNLLKSPVFKYAVPSQRCIIPATHFFEPDKKHFPKPPHPWYCFRRTKEPIMALAGLYNPWTDPTTNTELFTFTIITTTPNPVVGAYHDREPVQLPRELEKSWLNPDFTEPEQIMPMLKTSSPEQMESWHVADAVRNHRNDYPELLNPVT